MRMLTIASQKGGAGKPPSPSTSPSKPSAPAPAPWRWSTPTPRAAWRPGGAPAKPRPRSSPAVEIARLPAHLRTLERHQVELVVIDTPPALTDMIRAAIAVADLVLIPARPSPHDLRPVGVIVEMAEAAKLPLCFVVNGATPRTTAHAYL